MNKLLSRATLLMGLLFLALATSSQDVKGADNWQPLESRILAGQSYSSEELPAALRNQHAADLNSLLKQEHDAFVVASDAANWQAALTAALHWIAVAQAHGHSDEVHAMCAAATSHFRIGERTLSSEEFELAERYHALALDVAQNFGEPALEIEARLTAVQQEIALGGYETALPKMEQLSAAASRVADPLLQARVQDSLAITHAHLGNYRKAVTLLEEAIDLRKSGGKPPSGAQLNTLGAIHVLMGDLERALASMDTALETYKTNGQDLYSNNVRLNYCEALGYAGRLEEALALNEQVIAKYQSSDSFTGQIKARNQKADYLIGLRRYSEARTELEAALAILPDESGGYDHHAVTRAVYGDCLLMLGELALARTELELALPALNAFGDPSLLGPLLLNLSFLEELQQQLPAAEDRASKALALYSGSQSTIGLIQTNRRLAALRHKAGDINAAIDFQRQAFNAAAE